MDQKQQIKELANQIGKSLLKSNQSPQYYIASPFFDEMSRSWVKCKEDEFDGFNIPYFSPRQDGVNFNEEGLTKELRSERIRSIFKNNVRNLKLCNNICVNLTPCNGRLDIGTLWELGYWIGYHGNPFSEKEDNVDNTLACSEDLKDLLLDICKNVESAFMADNPLLDEGQVTNKGVQKSDMVLVFKGTSPKKIKKSLKFIGSTMDSLELNSTCSNFYPSDGIDTVFLIDELPFQLFIMMGAMYAKGIPYYTASFKGYGSNVMIAASSEGHINLPGLVDETYKDKIL